MIVAFDLDGTLCNIEHRLSYIQSTPKDWRAFFKACGNDEPIWPIIRVLYSMQIGGDHSIEIWSGRSDEVIQETQAWLSRHGINGYSQLRMRKEGDHRLDHVVKAEWFDALPERRRPILAFDDRQQVVDMWRSRGVRCCQVAPGDF